MALGNNFQPSIRFTDKAGAYPSGAADGADGAVLYNSLANKIFKILN